MGKTWASKRKKTIKKEPEIEIDSDGTFKPKLKKSETVKRQIEEAKLEEVKLKHHEFENIPQTPPDEALTNVIMSKPITIQTDETDTKVKGKKKTIKTKIKKPNEIEDVPSPSLKTG